MNSWFANVRLYQIYKITYDSVKPAVIGAQGELVLGQSHETTNITQGPNPSCVSFVKGTTIWSASTRRCSLSRAVVMAGLAQVVTTDARIMN